VVDGVLGKAGALELDGGVGDMEIGVEAFADGAQYFFTFVHMHVGDADVAGESDQIGADGPDVDVMNFLHSGNAQDGTRHFFQVNALGEAFEQNIAGFAEQAVGGIEDQGGDEYTDGWIEPLRAGHMDGHGSHQNSDVGKRVAQIVQEQAAEIDVAAAANQGQGDAAVDGQGQERDPYHPAFVNGDRMAEALEGLIEKSEGHQDQEDGIGERGQNAGALVAVGTFMIGGTRGPIQREPRDKHRGNVRKIVQGVADQGNGVADVAAQDFGDDQHEGGGHRSGKHPASDAGVRVRMAGGVIMAMRVSVHRNHCTGTDAGMHMERASAA
jgi:hypothetical protein